MVTANDGNTALRLERRADEHSLHLRGAPLAQPEAQEREKPAGVRRFGVRSAVREAGFRYARKSQCWNDFGDKLLAFRGDEALLARLLGAGLQVLSGAYRRRDNQRTFQRGSVFLDRHKFRERQRQPSEPAGAVFLDYQPSDLLVYWHICME